MTKDGWLIVSEVTFLVGAFFGWLLGKCARR